MRAILELVRADETVEAEAHSAAWREFLEQHPELKDEEDLGD